MSRQTSALQPVRLVEAEAIGDAGAPVVRHAGEARVAEIAHHLDDVARHGPLGVRLVAGALLARRRGPAIAAQVHRDDGEALRQGRCDAVPHHVALREAVYEDKGRPVSMHAREDAARRRIEAPGLEAGHQVGELGAVLVVVPCVTEHQPSPRGKVVWGISVDEPTVLIVC